MSIINRLFGKEIQDDILRWHVDHRSHIVYIKLEHSQGQNWN